MEKSPTPIPRITGSGCLALLAGSFIAAVCIPSLPTEPDLYLGVCAVAVLPGLCIFTLARRWRLVEWLAWLFLSYFLVAIFMG